MSKSNDGSTSGMQRVEKGNRVLEDPAVTVQASGGQGYFNSAAYEEFFEGHDTVGVYFDPDEHKVGFAPGEDHDDSYSVVVTDAGCVVTLIGAMNKIGVRLDELDENVTVPLTNGGDLVLADFSEVANE